MPTISLHCLYLSGPLYRELIRSDWLNADALKRNQRCIRAVMISHGCIIMVMLRMIAMAAKTLYMFIHWCITTRLFEYNDSQNLFDFLVTAFNSPAHYEVAMNTSKRLLTSDHYTLIVYFLSDGI